MKGTINRSVIIIIGNMGAGSPNIEVIPKADAPTTALLKQCIINEGTMLFEK